MGSSGINESTFFFFFFFFFLLIYLILFQLNVQSNKFFLLELLGPNIAPDRFDFWLGGHGVDQQHPVSVLQKLSGLDCSRVSNLSFDELVSTHYSSGGDCPPICG